MAGSQPGQALLLIIAMAIVDHHVAPLMPVKNPGLLLFGRGGHQLSG